MKVFVVAYVDCMADYKAGFAYGPLIFVFSYLLACARFNGEECCCVYNGKHFKLMLRLIAV